MANRNWLSGGKLYSGHKDPVLIDLNFIVDSANGNGLGIRSLKGPYVQNVFMHTSATPGAGSSNPATPGIAVINPNPAAGTIVIQLQDKYERIYVGGHSIVSALGSSSNTLSAGVAYVVTSVGSTTSAEWLAAGIPAGVLAAAGGLPVVGTAFISAISAAMGGSGTAAPTITTSPVGSIETVGDSNQALAPSGYAQGFGAQLILQCRQDGAIATPTDGTVIALSLILGNSSVMNGGE